MRRVFFSGISDLLSGQGVIVFLIRTGLYIMWYVFVFGSLERVWKFGFVVRLRMGRLVGFFFKGEKYICEYCVIIIFMI